VTASTPSRTVRQRPSRSTDAARVAAAGTDDRKWFVAALLLRRETALEPLDRGERICSN